MQNYSAERLFALLEDRKYSEFATLADSLPSAEVADFLGELDRDQLIFAFRLLKKETAAALLPSLDADVRLEIREGMADEPYLKVSATRAAAERLPWLLLLMLSSTFTGVIITAFESALASLVILTAFIPMLMGTGGNAGAQVSVTVTRALSLGELAPRDVLRVLRKELCVSLLCGLGLAAANFVKICVFDMMILKSAGVTVGVALTVSLTLLVTVVCAKLTGASLPLLAARLGFDPALAAGPAVTTVVDIVSLLVYFGTARLLLGL
ncbi:MAG: magnesium transporter [Clostridia bacterium]|nr:magnesium transporter [Clostridia bacterium]